MRLKDEQLKLLQNQNKKLLQTIENMEKEVQDAKNSVGSLNQPVQAQDENISLRAEVRRAEEERLEAEASFQKQIETSQHQIKVMADQNTELLRMLEKKEKHKFNVSLKVASKKIQKWSPIWKMHVGAWKRKMKKPWKQLKNLNSVNGN